MKNVYIIAWLCWLFSAGSIWRPIANAWQRDSW